MTPLEGCVWGNHLSHNGSRHIISSFFFFFRLVSVMMSFHLCLTSEELSHISYNNITFVDLEMLICVCEMSGE